MQDIWMEVCEETPVPGLPPPKQVQNEMMMGRALNEQERRETLQRLSLQRRLNDNFFLSKSAKNLANKTTDMSPSERQTIRNRLATRPAHSPPRKKSERASPKMTRTRRPTSPTTDKGMKRASRIEGVAVEDFTNLDARPSFEYKPAMHDKPWMELHGFAKSTRTLERRKMDPYADINSFQGNKASAIAQFNSKAHVRPLDVKGALGAEPVQKWKETLREDFSRDADNHSSNA